jgi:CubicO group peptidase (beta-lactamase class C family)
MDLEKMLVPLAPAGASWSNVRDAARYLITQLNRGIGPDGKRVVFAGNLEETWKPQVEIQPGLQYGLGWMIGSYRGRRLLAHAGGTSGFTSEFSFMPEDGLGIAILSNAQGAGIFVAGVRSRILELLFRQPADPKYAALLEESARHLRERTAGAQRADGIPAAYAGLYKHPSLGQVKVAVKGGKLVLSVPGYDNELRRLNQDTYVIWDPPMAGALIRFTKNGSGTTAMTLDADDPDIAGQYTFELSK